MSKTYITADSSLDLSKELIKENDIKIVPFLVALGDDTFEDGVNISPEDIYSYVDKTGMLPKTAAVNIADYEEVFKKYTADGSEVIHFNLGSGFSSTHQNAVIASEDIPGVYVIDTENLSTGIGLLALKACGLLKSGKSAKETAEIINSTIPKVESSFVLERLDYLYKGGRCSAVSVLGANILKLRPCIEVKDGAMDVGKKYRGKLEDCFYSYVKDRLDGRADELDTARIFITHSGRVDDETVDTIEKLILERVPFAEVIRTTAGSTISSHCGPRTLGILFIRK